MNRAIRKAAHPRRRNRFSAVAPDQGHPQGDAAGRRQTGDRAHGPGIDQPGITDITIVVSGGKSLIQEHFRPNLSLVEQLRADGKDSYADAVQEVGELPIAGTSPTDQHGPVRQRHTGLNAARSSRRRAGAGAVAQ